MSQIPDQGPNSLTPVNTVNVSKMSRWPLLLVMLAGLLLVGVLIYSVNFAHNPDEEEAKNKKVEITESEKPLLMGEGQGLALKPPKVAVVSPPDTVPADLAKEPLIVIAKEKDNSPYQQELENLRRMKQQALLTALASPISVKKASDTAQGSATGPNIAMLDQPSGPPGRIPADINTSYDVEADRDKEGFMSRQRTRDTDWISEGVRVPGQPFELKTGAVIPGVMISGVNSDLPGNLTAQVSQNVHDTATGRNILIPQGSKLYGVYDSRVIYGQERVLIAWNRVIFPDGSAFTLGAMPGADMEGYAGFTDEVNNHYLRIFGSAVFMSTIMGGSAYAMDSFNTTNSDKPSMQDEMMSALAAQFGQTTASLLQKNLNIKPTLEIRPGYQFNIVVTKDLVFARPYKAWR